MEEIDFIKSQDNTINDLYLQLDESRNETTTLIIIYWLSSIALTFTTLSIEGMIGHIISNALVIGFTIRGYLKSKKRLEATQKKWDDMFEEIAPNKFVNKLHNTEEEIKEMKKTGEFKNKK